MYDNYVTIKLIQCYRVAHPINLGTFWCCRTMVSCCDSIKYVKIKQEQFKNLRFVDTLIPQPICSITRLYGLKF